MEFQGRVGGFIIVADAACDAAAISDTPERVGFVGPTSLCGN